MMYYEIDFYIHQDYDTQHYHYINKYREDPNLLLLRNTNNFKFQIAFASNYVDFCHFPRLYCGRFMMVLKND